MCREGNISAHERKENVRIRILSSCPIYSLEYYPWRKNISKEVTGNRYVPDGKLAGDLPIRCYARKNKMNNNQTCTPPPIPLWQWPIALFFSLVLPGGLFAAVLLMPIELWNHFQTTLTTKIIVCMLGGLFGIATLMLFINWERNRWYWELTVNELKSGKRKNKIYNLSSIQKVIPALPDNAELSLTENNFDSSIIVNFLIREKIGITLKFFDGSLMPFNVYQSLNGSALMTELINRLNDRIDTTYRFTPEEFKLLKFGDWNKLRTRKGA